MNRWHIYNWLKQSFMYSGRVPSREAVSGHFRGTEAGEIEEGIIEFELMAGVKVKSSRKVAFGGNSRWIKGATRHA